jgi:hypothetical protein
VRIHEGKAKGQRGGRYTSECNKQAIEVFIYEGGDLSHETRIQVFAYVIGWYIKAFFVCSRREKKDMT